MRDVFAFTELVALLSPILQQKDWSLPWNPLQPPESAVSINTDNNVQPANAPIFILNGGFHAFLAGAYWIAKRLGSERPCYSIHLRGTDGKEAPHNCIEDMAADAIAGIQKLQPEGPYFLVGLCFGGAVAFEIAQQLRKKEQSVALLAMVEASAPEHQRKTKTGFGKQKKAKKKIVIPSYIFDDVTFADPNLLRVAKGIYRAMRTYEATIYPDKVILFQASEGDTKDIAQRKRHVSMWGKLTGELEVHKLPGDHMSLYEESRIGALVDQLRDVILRAG